MMGKPSRPGPAHRALRDAWRRERPFVIAALWWIAAATLMTILEVINVF